ncbi:MAG: CBS domain-containing protein [Pseudonocardiaceae bacterium]
MRIVDVLRRKGTEVYTVHPSTSVTYLLTMLAAHNVGALVVVEERTVCGIVSERDVVRRMCERGRLLLDCSTAEIMTAAVVSCTPEDSVDDVMRLMTEHRFRHVPVLVNGRLAGVVSIGDMVSARIGELEQEREQLATYIAHG